MSNWQKVIVLLVIISLGVAFGGYVFYRDAYKKPRATLAEQRAQSEQKIEQGRLQIKNMQDFSTSYLSLYTRSFPLNPQSVRLQYPIWLTQMLEFCNFEDVNIRLDERPVNIAGGRLTTLGFHVTGKCSLTDLTQFLYEFYWTPFLHRIQALDITPIEGSDELNVRVTINCLTIRYRSNPQQAYPLQNDLPLSVDAPRQLSSGPLAAYHTIVDLDNFRAVRTGIDATSLALLTSTSAVTDENGKKAVKATWFLQDAGTRISASVGETITVGSFVAKVLDISDDLVILEQNSDRIWALPLGYTLNQAVAIPYNLY
ncbi:MAG: hypothetical protein Q4G03_04060 [Planctomycetia bacterium]|nr:hypothetical protein [Planctomycetia bacterium]